MKYGSFTLSVKLFPLYIPNLQLPPKILPTKTNFRKLLRPTNISTTQLPLQFTHTKITKFSLNILRAKHLCTKRIPHRTLNSQQTTRQTSANLGRITTHGSSRVVMSNKSVENSRSQSRDKCIQRHLSRIEWSRYSAKKIFWTQHIICHVTSDFYH